MSTSVIPKRPIKIITCIQLSGVFPDFCHRLIMPDYGMPLIGTILSEAGYDVTVFMEHVKAPEWDRIASSDLVCMSTLSAGVEKTIELANRIRSRARIPVILGGTHATYFPESCLDFCDYVVLGEGDETILELCSAISQGNDISSVPGVVFKIKGEIIHTGERQRPRRIDTIPNFSLIKGYKSMSLTESIIKLRFPLLTVQASRGCPYSCKYCIVDTMYPGRYTTRSIESIIKDLRDKRQYGKELLFVDNNFSANPNFTKSLLKRIIEEDFGFDIMVLTRIDIAYNNELLQLMRDAGITQLYQGYESIQPETLNAYDKRQSVENISKAIERFHSYGFRLSGSFVIGADTDTVETIHSTVDFVLSHNLTIAYLFPIWGHYKELKNSNSSLTPWYRSIFKGWAYCDGNFVTHFPLLIKPSTLQWEIILAHRNIFSFRTITKSLYERNYANAWEKQLHRWMWSKIEKALIDYIPWLEELEQGLYDENNRLIESKLLDRVTDKAWPFFPENIPDTVMKGLPAGFESMPVLKDEVNCLSSKIG